MPRRKEEKYYQGLFSPKNTDKYRGKPTEIIFRSYWEYRVMNFLDSNPNVLWWSSEELAIPYISPIDGRRHRYFPDMIAKFKRKDGSERIVMIEVKPLAQTREPKVPRRKTKRFLTEVETWGVNSAKWEAARAYCRAKGWDFMFITEKELDNMS